MINVDQVAALVEASNFKRTRQDQWVHITGFDKTGNVLRSVVEGANQIERLNANRGVTGPLVVEIGYGSKTVRTRFFRGYDLIGMWDLQTDWADHKLQAWFNEFREYLEAATREDEVTRDDWEEER